MSVLAGLVFAVAGVMGVAGVLKLAHPSSAASAMKAAGLTGSPFAAQILAVIEIGVAASALAFGSSVTAALMALCYAGFAAFAGLLIRRAGAGAPCGCFGETKPQPTTWIHVAMNLAAALLCAAAVLWPTGGVVDVLREQPLAGVPFVVLTVLCGWLWYLCLTVIPSLMSRAGIAHPETHRDLREGRVPDPPQANDLSGVGLHDEVLTLRVVGAGHRTLLAFLSSSCTTCATFWERFARREDLAMPAGTALVIVTRSPDEESQQEIAKIAPTGTDLVMSSEAWNGYRVPGSPYFVLAEGATRRILFEGTSMSWEQLASLLSDALAETTVEGSKPETPAEREMRIDQELMAAGILLNDPALPDLPNQSQLESGGRRAEGEPEPPTTR